MILQYKTYAWICVFLKSDLTGGWLLSKKKRGKNKTTRRNSVLRSELREVLWGLGKKIIIPQNGVSNLCEIGGFNGGKI